MSKSGAFVTIVLCVMLVFVGALIMVCRGKITDLPVGVTVGALVTMGTTYVGLQVANNGVKGKFYREELHEEKSE